MLFSEIYGSYYATVAEILSSAVTGTLTGARLSAIVQDKAFGESVLTIPEALRNGDWKLLLPDYTTPLKRIPSTPLTDIEKRWLKALLLDPRIRLFGPSEAGLEDVEPLFSPDMFCFYDRYADGDDYTDENYISNFRKILDAVNGRRRVKIVFKSRFGNKLTVICVPYKLEYSEKDDKFRLIAAGGRRMTTIKLSSIISCEVLERCPDEEFRIPQPKMKTLVIELLDERNALERAMLHFSHLEKETERLDDRHYRISIRYQQDDETELVIRVLSFGPVIKVVSPDDFAEKVKERLYKQKSCGV